MTLEEQLSALLAKHDLLSVGICAMAHEGKALIQASVQCKVSGVRTAFQASDVDADLPPLLREAIEKANAARIVPAEVEQLSRIAA